ncbi:DUF1232 domain-containing protein [Candidatus Dojkabacteria bacterium]|uniref:DUF1232 domain-containing protein n=1 Tax=Candidatus Dojkabacteria bacterium TaxID=2099670 RepID=A0A847ETC7_9BACT|nr:DUF1232 domain-containing protein [Candidatus Dojkabacteria bacterium]
MKKFIEKYWLFILSIIYIILPVDLIPDVIPFLGGLDDSALVILSLVKQYIDNKKGKESGV